MVTRREQDDWQEKHMGRDGLERKMWPWEVKKEEKKTGLRKWVSMGMVREEGPPVRCQRVSTPPSHPTPTLLCLIPSFRAPTPTSLTFVPRAGWEQKGQQKGQQQEGHGAGVGQGQARRSLSPGRLKSANSTSEERCRALQRGKGSRQ